MWDHIGKVAEHKDSIEFSVEPRRSIDSETGKVVNDGLLLFADCHAAIKGTFVGNRQHPRSKNARKLRSVSRSFHLENS